VLWLRAYPLDSGEPQHAHVAWSIGQGDLALSSLSGSLALLGSTPTALF
jgi:hypothetical protein